MAEKDVECPSSDDLEIPKWLNAAFLEKHLCNYYKNDLIKVHEFDAQSGTAKGENYASSIYRVKVTYNKNSTDSNQPTSRNLILKAALTTGLAFESLSAHNVFEKEIEFYDKIAPKINELLGQLDESNGLIAETFGVCRANKVMIFEDLSAKGYGLWSIKQGFNAAGAKTILKKLATFHGICSVLQEMHPDIFANYKYGAMNPVTDVFHNFYYGQMDALIEAVSLWPDFDQYTEKLRRLRNNVIEKGCQMFHPNPSHFNTLNHGDFWLNNILIKPKDGDADSSFQDLIFIDFQDSCWASPVIDLHYFLNTSLSETLRPSAFNELVRSYHEQLAMVLRWLNYGKNIPTQEQFLEQFTARNFYGFITACTTHPFMINESTEDAELDAMIGTDERSLKYRRTMYQQPNVQANLRKLIPIYDQLGVFD